MHLFKAARKTASIVQSIMGGAWFSDQPHRARSGQLIWSTLLWREDGIREYFLWIVPFSRLSTAPLWCQHRYITGSQGKVKLSRYINRRLLPAKNHSLFVNWQSSSFCHIGIRKIPDSEWLNMKRISKTVCSDSTVMNCRAKQSRCLLSGCFYRHVTLTSAVTVKTHTVIAYVAGGSWDASPSWRYLSAAKGCHAFAYIVKLLARRWI